MLNNKCIFLMLVISLLLVACDSKEIKVKEAAQKRWTALIAGDFDSAYDLYSESYKNAVDLQSFRKKTKGVGLWKKADVQAVDCNQAQKECQAKVKVTVALKMRGIPQPVETSNVLQETWVNEGLLSDWRYIKK